MPIDGQPPSIVQDLEDMCRQYIKVWWGAGSHGGALAGASRAGGAGWRPRKVLKVLKEVLLSHKVKQPQLLAL